MRDCRRCCSSRTSIAGNCSDAPRCISREPPDHQDVEHGPWTEDHAYMGEPRDTETPAPPTALLRRLAQSAYWRGCKRCGDSQPLVDPDHLVHLWRRQNGRSAVNGLLFSDERFDDALVKRPYQASLDRIDPSRPYLEGNMHLVRTAVHESLRGLFVAQAVRHEHTGLSERGCRRRDGAAGVGGSEADGNTMTAGPRYASEG